MLLIVMQQSHARVMQRYKDYILNTMLKSYTISNLKMLKAVTAQTKNCGAGLGVQSLGFTLPLV